MPGKFYIEQELNYSLRHGTAIGIKLRDKEIVISGVLKIQPFGDDKLIAVTPTTLHGNTIEQSSIMLSEIDDVLPMSVKYDDPLYQRLRQAKEFFQKKS